MTIDFTLPELNALSKLLATIKTEANLTADEVNFFALSPHIISAFEKVQKSYVQNKGSSTEKDFQFPEFYLETIKKRIRDLDEAGLTYIKEMNQAEKEAYCDLIFAPYKPSEYQKQAMIDQLEAIGS